MNQDIINMTQQVLIDPLQESEILQSSSSELNQQGSGSSYQLVELDATKNRSNILKRTNFRQEERNVLVSLISEYKCVLDRRVSKDAGMKWRPSNLTPTEAWQLITEKYNSQPGFCKRDASQLRKCWMNMKARSQFSMAQRRQLGLECSSSRPPSRGFKSRQNVPVRLRNTSTPTLLNARSFTSRKSNHGRTSNSAQLKVKKAVKQRTQQEGGYNPHNAQRRGYHVTKPAQEFSNYQGDSDLRQFVLQNKRNSQRQPQPVQIHRSVDDPQSRGVQGLSELRTNQGYLIQDLTSADQRSSNIQGQPQMITVSQSFAQSSNRSRPIAGQPRTILSQMEQFSPPMPQRLMSNTITVGEFLGKAVEVRHDDTQAHYSTSAEAASLDVSLQHLHSEDNHGSAPESTADESTITYQTVSQVRSIDSMADLESVLDTGGPIISNVTSISNARHKGREETNDKDVEEIQIIIKTEDEVLEQTSSIGTQTRSERDELRGKGVPRGADKHSQQENGKGSKSSTDSSIKKPRKISIDMGTQTEIVPEGRNKRESVDGNRSEKTNTGEVVLANSISTSHDKNEHEMLQIEPHYIEDDIMEQDDSFIPVETDPKEQDDIDDHLDQTEDPHGTFEDSENLKEHENKEGAGFDLADEERKARMDLLFYEVEKAKEDAGAARCRRELLEVEVQAAKQQMELTRRKQEAEIQLMQEKVRQERAKADNMLKTQSPDEK
ncbi:uncharacterized protein LOC121411019 [Lytechinus variegatus]|uniref:uncharacterized protein LOC121411019 n=1 Tax=Lytechinus variegatus TaxID=7654 RepID=UPI001BB1689F|nr:uncharacterized protein LOC121411019 [Lytechinus variegatus]